MKRREVLAGLGVAGAAGLGGCLGGGSDGGGGLPGGFGFRPARVPPVVQNRPDTVYVPSHFEGMEMVGTKRSGGHRVALSYTFPHRFWTTQAGEGTKKVGIQRGDTVHMMVSAWYPDAGVYVTDAAPSIEVTKGGESVVGANNPWSMLSQPMGFHWGDNLQLDGRGTYTVTVETAAPSTRRTGALRGVGDRGSFEFEFEFRASKLRNLKVKRFSDRKGSKGALDPMDTEMPLARAPEPDALPGRPVGTATSGDATFVVRAVPDAASMGVEGGGTYLLVSPRTPHNRFVVPQMSLRATVKRGGETVAQEPLVAALGSAANFHYGAAVDGLEAGDRVRIDVQSPPQVARHEGYETAFLKMDPMELRV